MFHNKFSEFFFRYLKKKRLQLFVYLIISGSLHSGNIFVVDGEAEVAGLGMTIRYYCFGMCKFASLLW
jgi:hypothetical protein